MFLFEGGTPGDLKVEGQLPNRFNISNKIILIYSLVLFYVLPLILSNTINLNKFKTKTNNFIFNNFYSCCFFFRL